MVSHRVLDVEMQLGWWARPIGLDEEGTTWS
jgi:hypothetical protein